MPYVYKIFRAEEFRAFQACETFSGSVDDLRDGFIHLSFEEQLPGTLARHFGGEAEVVIVEFAAEALGSALKLERSRSGALFPHLYGALDWAHARRTLVTRPRGDLLWPQV